MLIFQAVWRCGWLPRAYLTERTCRGNTFWASIAVHVSRNKTSNKWSLTVKRVGLSIYVVRPFT